MLPAAPVQEFAAPQRARRHDARVAGVRQPLFCICFVFSTLVQKYVVAKPWLQALMSSMAVLVMVPSVRTSDR